MFDFLKTRYQKIKRIFFPGELTAERKEELEQTLYEADLGSTVVQELIDSIDEKDISNSLKKKALEILQAPPITSVESINSPHVILMIGVNGAGKTTTTAKLANHYQKLGKKVLVAAADTFRAGAIEQLDVWAKKLNLDIVKGRQGADPSSVIFDALESGKSKKADIVIVDTAGRLESKEHLMKELDKIYRVMKKFDPTAPHEVLLVLDATLGQNIKDQALNFHKYSPITGFVVTKLDGSSKGGIILRLYREMGIKTKWIGLGEAADDLLSFDAERYVEALFS